jgi:hypothetical protein
MYELFLTDMQFPLHAATAAVEIRCGAVCFNISVLFMNLLSELHRVFLTSIKG